MECKACGREHDVNRGGWVILATDDLICDPVDRPDCWEKVSGWYIQRREEEQLKHHLNRGLTNANT